MHTHAFHGVIFHHNGDFSGEVIIHKDTTQEEIEIPFEAIKDLVALYVGNHKISVIEQQSSDELLLGIKEPTDA